VTAPPDPVRRAAARTATLVALPLVLIIALGSLWIFGGFSIFSGPAAPPPPKPQVTSPVTLPIPALAPSAVGVCREVIAKLPATVVGSARRPVSGPEQNAAYGDPPITLACGAAPVTVAPTEDLIELNGVCWATRSATPATTYITVDRAVPVSVTVPGPSAGSAQTVVGFSDSIRTNDPTAAHFPTGCTG
jgi:hypothetical protein